MSSRRSSRFSCFFVAVLVLCASGAGAADATPPFWRAQSDTSTVYVLGSVHALRPSDYPLPDTVENAYRQSDVLVLEVNLGELDPAAMQQITLGAGMLSGGKRLTDVLTPGGYRKAAELAGKLGYNLQTLAGLEPWLAALTLLAMEMQKAGFDPAQGVDQVFAGKASRDGKRIIGLESLEFQLGLFDDMSAEVQEKFLLQTLEEAANFEVDMNELVGAWRSGNIRVLEELSLAGFQDYPEVYQKLVVKRNREWLNRLEQYLGGNEDYFVVVGALHLVGDDSIIKHLEEKGYRIEKL